MSGGSSAVDGGIVPSTERMREITVDPVTRVAVTQPGLLSAEVKKAAPWSVNKRTRLDPITMRLI